VQKQKFLSLLFVAIAFCFLTGCASMNSASLPKKIYQFNFSEPAKSSIINDLNKQIGNSITVLPFIDKRKTDDINFALQKPISIVARDCLVVELKKDKLFENISVSDDTTQIGSAKNIMYGIIETFKMYFDMEDSITNEDPGIVHKTYFAFTGKIIYVGNDGRAIVHEYIGSIEIYMPFIYFKNNNITCYAPDSSLPNIKYQEFNIKLSDMFSRVMHDACNDIAYSNKFTYFYNVDPGDYINKDSKFLTYNKYDEISMNEGLVVGLTTAGSILAGICLGSQGVDTRGNPDNPLPLLEGILGGAIGAVLGLFIDGTFIYPEYTKQSFYAEYPSDENKGLILCKNF
jgi:hypothetical protein